MRKQEHIFFLGIGGIGMSALAHYALELGHQISGYDAKDSYIIQQLKEKGAQIIFNIAEISNKQNIDRVIYTPAFSTTSHEYQTLLALNVPIQKRSEALGDLLSDYQVFAVAGTHGKTSVSALLAFILTTHSEDNGGFVGGWMNNWNSNFKLAKIGAIVVVEADEYDRSFLHLNPNCIGITAMDPDHLDVYGTYKGMIEGYKNFVSNLQADGTCIINGTIQQIPEIESVLSQHQELYSYSTDGFKIYDLELNENGLLIAIEYNNDISKSVQLPIFGKFNAENICLAVAMATKANIDINTSLQYLQKFKGVKRRFELHYSTKTKSIFEDYAHHPVEISSAIDALKAHFPNQHIAIAFQPHLYSRTLHLANEFSESLIKADSVYIHEIYPAREAPIPGVSARLISEKIPNAIYGNTEDDLTNWALQICNQEELVICLMGAGDFTQFLPSIINKIGGCDA